MLYVYRLPDSCMGTSLVHLHSPIDAVLLECYQVVRGVGWMSKEWGGCSDVLKMVYWLPYVFRDVLIHGFQIPATLTCE